MPASLDTQARAVATRRPRMVMRDAGPGPWASLSLGVAVSCIRHGVGVLIAGSTVLRSTMNLARSASRRSLRVFSRGIA